ncbi:MAG: CRAL-TRIO domain-containing protein, partial [Piptocephalis tieghemiana]
DDLRRTFWHTVRTDHPDTLLLRFLRARKWDLPKALAMLVNALRWQFTENVDRVIADGEDAIPLNQFESGKTLVRGVDLQGRPVTYVRARFHFKDAQTAEVNKLFTILTMETVRIMLSPPVETATMVFDLRGLTMANSDLGTIKFLVGCFEAFYPESLGKALIVGAPWIFWGLWRVISPLLDPVVASKICILKKESELLDYIAPDQLVSSLGGEDDRPYVYIPPFPEDQMRLQDVTEKERLIELVTEIQGRLTQATKDWDGSVESPEYHQRMELAEELRRRTLALDPYVRARVNLHRLDVIREDGTTDF